MTEKGIEIRLIELLDQYLDHLLTQTKNDDKIKEKETIKATISAAFKDAGIKAPIIPDIPLCQCK
jgi:hypothetical protein